MDDELPNGNSSDNHLPEDIVDKLSQVVNEHYAKKEREDAHDLIMNAFTLLPMELQDLYHDIVTAYRAGEYEEASKLFEEWLDEARDLGLI